MGGNEYRVLNMPRASVYLSASQNYNSGTTNDPVWNTLIYDTDNTWSATLNPGRFTCKTPGVYMHHVYLPWDPAAGGFRQLLWAKNGSVYSQDVVTPVPGAATTNMSMARILALNVGDYVEGSATQTSGGPLNLLGGTFMVGGNANVAQASFTMLSTL